MQGDENVGVYSSTPAVSVRRSGTSGGPRNGLAGRHQHWDGPQSLKLRIHLRPNHTWQICTLYIVLGDASETGVAADFILIPGQLSQCLH